MGFAKYLLRFDDAHEAMDFKKWETITSIIIRNKLKPIVAVILEIWMKILLSEQRFSKI